MDMWCAAAGDPYPMEKNPEEIPMFAWFVNLNPNGIFQISVFIHFCEAFVRIKPHWVLFQKFFLLKPQPSANDPRVVRGAGI
jgi:hypothetical protein